MALTVKEMKNCGICPNYPKLEYPTITWNSHTTDNQIKGG